MGDGVRAFCTVLVATCAAFASTAVSAETLPVEGIYGSNIALPAEIEVIATEAFGGDMGPDVMLDLSERLGSVYIEGQPFFRIVPATTATAVDAVFRGSVRSVFSDRRVNDKVTRECIARDADGDCTEREEVRARCDEFSVRLDPRILLVDREGRQLYSRREAVSQKRRVCVDEEVELDPDAALDALSEQLVGEIRADLAPVQLRRDIRVMESRKALARSDRDAFRAAVRLTKTDPDGACSAFESLEANNPGQISVLFNIGLCYEMVGAWDLAEDYYNRALEVDPGRDYPTQGLGRLADARRGQAQWEARLPAEPLQ